MTLRENNNTLRHQLDPSQRMNTHSHVRTEDKWIDTQETQCLWNTMYANASQCMPMHPAYHIHAGVHSPHTLVCARAHTLWFTTWTRGNSIQPVSGKAGYLRCYYTPITAALMCNQGEVMACALEAHTLFLLLEALHAEAWGSVSRTMMWAKANMF